MKDSSHELPVTQNSVVMLPTPPTTISEASITSIPCGDNWTSDPNQGPTWPPWPPTALDEFDQSMTDWLNDIIQDQNLISPSPFSSETTSSSSILPYVSPASQLLLPLDVLDELQSTWKRFDGGNSPLGDVIQNLIDICWTTAQMSFPIFHNSSFTGSTPTLSLLTAMAAFGAIVSVDPTHSVLAVRLFSYGASIIAMVRSPMTRVDVQDGLSESKDIDSSRLQGLQALLLLSMTGSSLGENQQHVAHGYISHTMTVSKG